MGENVLVDTMGEENVYKAKQLLGLPKNWSLREVAAYLLNGFHETYPGIRDPYYSGVVEEVLSSSKIVSKAIHYMTALKDYEKEINNTPVWTRYCFSNPTKSKTALNAYVAHSPQSLNAQTLNKAWMKVFYNIAMHPKHKKNFKLSAQVHDSIIFQWREGHEYLCDMVKRLMEIPITIKAYDGKIRTFIVPASVKNGIDVANGNYSKYWSETE